MRAGGQHAGGMWRFTRCVLLGALVVSFGACDGEPTSDSTAQNETPVRVRFRLTGDPATVGPDAVSFDVAASVSGTLHVQFLDRPGPLRTDGSPPRPHEESHAGFSWSTSLGIEGGTTEFVFRIVGGAGHRASGIELAVRGRPVGEPGALYGSNRPKPFHELRVAAACAVDTELGYVEIGGDEPIVLHYWVFGAADEELASTADGQGTPVLRIGGRPRPLTEHDAPVWVLRAWFVPR